MKGNGQTAEEHQNEFRDKCDRGCLATGGLHTNPLYSDRNHVLNALFPVYWQFNCNEIFVSEINLVLVMFMIIIKHGGFLAN